MKYEKICGGIGGFVLFLFLVFVGWPACPGKTSFFLSIPSFRSVVKLRSLSIINFIQCQENISFVLSRSGVGKN